MAGSLTVVRHVAKYKLHLVGIQDIRWVSSGMK
jgi:hypothetical protein